MLAKKGTIIKVLKEVFEWSKVVFCALAISLLIKNTVAASAVVPTGSMEETVMTGSRIVINRLAYCAARRSEAILCHFIIPMTGKRCI